jgi:hypothetical protein
VTGLRAGRSFACAFLIFVAIVISLQCVTAQTVGPTVKIELSPTAISPGGTTILDVTLSNPRNVTHPVNVTYSQLKITPVIPTDWNISVLTPLPVQSLMSEQSLLAEYRISTQPNVTLGNYSVHVIVSWNGTYSAIYSGPVVVQYVVGPTFPGDIPFALAVMILPGFIAFALGVYLGGSKLDGRSALQLSLVSILLGAFIWQTGKWGLILSNPNMTTVMGTLLDTAFLSGQPLSWYFWNVLNLQNIWIRTVLIAVAIAVAARIGGWVNGGWDKLRETVGSKFFGLVGGALSRWVRGYEREHISAWEAQMRSSSENNRGYRTLVTLSLGQQAKAANGKPKKTENGQDATKTVNGLFISGDPKDPSNLILDPQYIVENDTEKETRDLLASSAHLFSFLARPFLLRSSIKKCALDDLNKILQRHGDIIENALQRAMSKNKKVNYRFLTGRTLIREQISRWEMSVERQPMATFRFDGREIPTPEMQLPFMVSIQYLQADAKRTQAHTAASVERMKTNLEKEGQIKPIEIDKNFNILDGNLRYMAARQLGQPVLTAVMK